MIKKKISEFELLAEEAAKLEREGAWLEASKAWARAVPYATNTTNREWANSRQMHCLCATGGDTNKEPRWAADRRKRLQEVPVAA
ncbi:ANR family transcriptional regulator [Aeromonas enteropelogenes]|uniref:ANR family transcriptional regulator n=1 Tax=Aeromonas enteropelogenes TaxID=29489 RepID=UPI003BA29EFB